MLIDIQPVVDIIALSLQSAFLSESNGVSLLILGKPETAKTSAIFSFSNLDFVSYYDEITPKRMIDEFLSLVRLRQKRTLLIPDLINCIEKQASTRDTLLALIKSGIDDTGIKNISTYHKQIDVLKQVQGLKFNLITALTTNSFANIKRYMKNTGLLSRFVPFSYQYPISLVKKIFEYIEAGSVDGYVTIPEIVKTETSIDDTPLFKEFEVVALKMASDADGYGFRALHALKRLAKANALLNGRKEVEKEDINKVIYLSKWFNFNFNPIM